jgi:hypothetical protein
MVLAVEAEGGSPRSEFWPRAPYAGAPGAPFPMRTPGV